ASTRHRHRRYHEPCPPIHISRPAGLIPGPLLRHSVDIYLDWPGPIVSQCAACESLADVRCWSSLEILRAWVLNDFVQLLNTAKRRRISRFFTFSPFMPEKDRLSED